MCFPINRCWWFHQKFPMVLSESPTVEAVRVDMDAALGVSTEALEQPSWAEVFLSELSSVARIKSLPVICYSHFMCCAQSLVLGSSPWRRGSQFSSMMS